MILYFYTELSWFPVILLCSAKRAIYEVQHGINKIVFNCESSLVCQNLALYIEYEDSNN